MQIFSKTDMMKKDIRWIQRFENYRKAFSKLDEGVQLAGKRKLTELEQQGLIQAFEYTHELAWNTLKDFLTERGNSNIFGSKDATRAAFRYELIENGKVWMDMITSRNKTSHTYNEDTAGEILHAIIYNYYDEFKRLLEKLSELKSKEIG